MFLHDIDLIEYVLRMLREPAVLEIPNGVQDRTDDFQIYTFACL